MSEANVEQAAFMASDPGYPLMPPLPIIKAEEFTMREFAGLTEVNELESPGVMELVHRLYYAAYDKLEPTLIGATRDGLANAVVTWLVARSNRTATQAWDCQVLIALSLMSDINGRRN